MKIQIARFFNLRIIVFYENVSFFTIVLPNLFYFFGMIKLQIIKFCHSVVFTCTIWRISPLRHAAQTIILRINDLLFVHCSAMRNWAAPRSQ